MTTYTYDSLVSVYDTALYDSGAVGAPLVELLLNSVWTDVTGYVRTDQGITITRGRQDESSAPTPATCALTFDNADGRFTPSYTSGAYYPYVMRNTQLRVSVIDDSGTGKVRFWGEVAEWPIEFDYTAHDVQVAVVGSGIRRRLARVITPHVSAYKGAELAVTPLVGYWPMEDADGATSFASALDGGVPGSFSGGGTLANDTTLIASDPLPTFTGTGTATLVAPAYTPSGTGQQVRWLQCDTTDSTTLKTFNCIVDTSGAYFFEYVWQPSTNTEALYMIAYTAPTVVVATNGPFASGANLGTTGSRMSVELKQNGANIEMNVEYLLVGGGTGFSFGVVSTAGTLGRVTGVRYFANDPAVTYTVGHVSVENHITSIFDVGGATGPLNAYAGETAAARATRVGTSAGFPALVTTLGTSEPMGPQVTDSPLAVWDETAVVDDGLSTEVVDQFGLQWRGRNTMVDTATGVQLDLTRMTGVTILTDDQRTENDVTVVRDAGGSARVIASTGLTPAAVGTYASEYDLNLYTDSQCAPQAGWRMSKGSMDKPRWPSIQFEMLSGLVSAIRDAVIAMREGDLVALTATGATGLGFPATEVVRLLGWSETITPNRWDFTLNCVPGQPWNQVFVLDSAFYGILDTDRLGL